MVWSQLISAMVRWLAMMLVGYLVKSGVIDKDLGDSTTNAVVGVAVPIIITALVVGWKYLAAQFQRTAFFTALRAHPDTPPEKVTEEAQEKATSPLNILSY